jgi:hypothetical protein
MAAKISKAFQGQYPNKMTAVQRLKDMVRRMNRQLDQSGRIGSSGENGMMALKKILIAVALLFAMANSVFAQTIALGPRFVLPYQTVIDGTGVPVPGAFLFFYSSGTNVKLNTYSDALLTTPNPNPVPANAAGQFPNIFLDGNYKVVLTDSLFNQLWTADPVSGTSPNPVGSGAPGDVPQYDSSGTRLVDGATISTNQSFYFGSGRPWCDVRSQGATGTALTSQTDDAAAFRACVTTLNALGGGILYVPPGNYCLKTAASASNFALNITNVSIRVVGAGLYFPSQIYTCGANIGLIYENVTGSSVEQLEYTASGGQGDPGASTGIAASYPAIQFGSSCGLCTIDHVRGFGGLYGLDNEGSDTWVSDFSFGYAYGAAIIHSAGSGHRYLHGAVDQNWPVVLPNVNSLTISAWQSSHSYSGNGASNTNVVSTGGYNIQLFSASCVSGGTAPTVLTYGHAITDGTCTWQLVGNATQYVALDCDGNCTEMIVHGEVDINCGGCTDGFAMTNNNAGTAPNTVEIDGSSFGQEIVSNIGLYAGSIITISNNHMSGGDQTNSSAIYVPNASFTGAFSAFGNHISLANSGISVGIVPSSISGYSIIGNKFDSVGTAINYFGAAGAVHLTAGHNTMYGATTAFTVTAGSSYYEFTNNDINGAALSYTIGDAHKIVTGNDGLSTGSGATVLATSPTLTTPTLTIPTLNGGIITLGSDATGDMYYRNSGGTLSRLPVCTGTQVIGASGGIPACVTQGGTGAALTYLCTITASNSASLNNASPTSGSCPLNNSYTSYELVFQNIVPATNEKILELQVHSGGVYKSTGYLSNQVVFINNGSLGAGSITTYIPLTYPLDSNGDALGNTAPGFSGQVFITNPSASNFATIYGNGMYLDGSGVVGNNLTTGYWNTTGAVDGFQVLMDSGNITSGSILVYGVQ